MTDLIKKPSWEPSASDINWQKRMLLSINDKGQWHVPGNGSLYTFDRINQIMWLEEGPVDELNWKISLTVQRTNTGWKVKRRDRADEKKVITEGALQAKTLFNAAAFGKIDDAEKEARKLKFVDALVELNISPLRIGALEITNGMVCGIFLAETRKDMDGMGLMGWSKEDVIKLPEPIPNWR